MEILTKERNAVLFNPKLFLTNGLSLQKLKKEIKAFTEKQFVSRDESEAKDDFRVFDLSDFLSRKHNNIPYNWVSAYKCILFDWDIDVKSLACSYWEVWDEKWS